MTHDNLIYSMDAIEEMQDKFVFLTDNLERLIFDLQKEDRYNEAISILFREFHTLKALVTYLNIKPMRKTLHIFEDILAILRHKTPPISKELFSWMLMIADMISQWGPSVEQGDFDVEPVDAYILNMVKTSMTKRHTSDELLTKSRILVITEYPIIAKRVKEYLEPRVEKLYIAKKVESIRKILQSENITLVICPSVMKSAEVIELFIHINKNYQGTPIVIHRLSVLSAKKQDLLRKLGISQYISKDFGEGELLQKLEIIVKAYTEDKGIKLLMSPLLKEQIESLKPLPETVKEVQKFRTEPERPLRDLSTIITRDPALSSKILRQVNSPSFGLRGTVNSVQQAVSLIGKDKTVALALQSFAEDAFVFDLTPYGMSVEDFYEVANKRMNLVVAWYSKVSLPDCSILSTAALIGNLGQLLISCELKHRKIEQTFATMASETTPMVAELECLHTSTEDMTADVLTYWGLEDNLINIIRYAHDLTNAPDDLKPLVVACYVTYRTIDLSNSKLNDDIVDEMCDLLQEMNFDPKLYKRAVDKVLR